MSEESVLGRKDLFDEFWKVSLMLESLMHQKTRCKWLKEKDGNTKLFHAMINGRRKMNMLRGLHDQVNDRLEDDL